MITRPLLAATVEDINTLTYPVLASPKLDGIRILNVDGKIVTRKFKPLPNNYAREILERYTLPGMDGEIMLNGNQGFNEIYSKLMSIEGNPEFVFYAFDWVQDLAEPFKRRLPNLEKWLKEATHDVRHFIGFLAHRLISTPEELAKYEDAAVGLGYEGVMLRAPNGPYKCGRSTLKEQILVKLKRFEDDEAVVVGFVEKRHNQNELQLDELGYAKRSKHQSGMVGAGTLGAFIVHHEKFGEFELSGKLNDALKKDIWENQSKYLGKTVTFKYQPHGMVEKPRIPVFKGFRSDVDV